MVLSESSNLMKPDLPKSLADYLEFKRASKNGIRMRMETTE